MSELDAFFLGILLGTFGFFLLMFFCFYRK